MSKNIGRARALNAVRSNRTAVYEFQAFQVDAESITSSKVQYWRNGVMATAQMTPETAKELVNRGMAFVITSQAIGEIRDGRPNS